MNRGSYEWVNFLEKRQAVITYEDYYQNWKADPKDRVRHGNHRYRRGAPDH